MGASLPRRSGDQHHVPGPIAPASPSTTHPSLGSGRDHFRFPQSITQPRLGTRHHPSSAFRLIHLYGTAKSLHPKPAPQITDARSEFEGDGPLKSAQLRTHSLCTRLPTTHRPLTTDNHAMRKITDGLGGGGAPRRPFRLNLSLLRVHCAPLKQTLRTTDHTMRKIDWGCALPLCEQMTGRAMR